jgi:hypothetical protein
MLKMEPALITMIANMPEKTGKSLEQWKKILAENNFEKHGEGLKFLKANFQVSHGFANTIVSLYLKDSEPEQDLVQQQYSGKANLLPLYQSILNEALSLGSDVKVTPKKGSVSIIRKRQFLLIKPATKSRMDLGFKLRDIPVGERLAASGPFGTMCTHRVCVSSTEELDAELKAWIRMAYEQSI